MTLDTSGRTSLLEAVKTPLAFLVLGMVIMEGALAWLSLRLSGTLQIVVVVAAIALVLLFVLIVVALAVWRPEALQGVRPLHATQAQVFASDLFHALDGSLANLSPTERREAWQNLVDVIASSSSEDGAYRSFTAVVGARIATMARLERGEVVAAAG